MAHNHSYSFIQITILNNQEHGFNKNILKLFLPSTLMVLYAQACWDHTAELNNVCFITVTRLICCHGTTELKPPNLWDLIDPSA